MRKRPSFSLLFSLPEIVGENEGKNYRIVGVFSFGAGEGNRTLVSKAGSPYSLFMFRDQGIGPFNGAD